MEENNGSLTGQAEISDSENQEFEAIHEIEKLLLGEKGEPKKEASPAETEQQKVADESQQEQSEEETNEEPKYKVKVSGVETEVSLSELLNGYQRQSDYTKKTMEIAEQRKSIEQEQQKINELAQIRQTYADRLDILENILGQGISEEELLRINEEQGAEAWIRAKAEESQRQARLNKIRAEKERIMLENQNQYMVALAKARAQALETIPELKEKETYSKLSKVLLDYGFTQDEVDATADPRALKIALKALEAIEFQNARQTLEKNKVTPETPKMQKPSARVSESELKRESLQKKQAQLRRTGSLEDAANLLADMLL